MANQTTQARKGEQGECMKHFRVRVEVYVEAEDRDIALERGDRLMEPIDGAPWLSVFSDEVTSKDHQILERKYPEWYHQTIAPSVWRRGHPTACGEQVVLYAVRVQVYVEAEGPEGARKQVERLMEPIEFPWLIRVINGWDSTDQLYLDEKYGSGNSSDSSNGEPPPTL